MKRVFAYIFSSIQLILAILFLYQLFRFNILPADIFCIVGGIVLLFSALTLFLSKAKKVRWPVFVIAVIFIAILSMGNYYLYITRGVLNNATGKNIYSVPVEEYISVIVLSDTDAESIADLNGLPVGVDTSFEGDKMKFASEWITKQYKAQYTETIYDRLDLIIDDLYNGTITAIIMDSTRYTLCDDIKESFHSDTKEIAKLKIDYTEYHKVNPTNTPTPTPTKAPVDVDEGGITEKPFIVYISGIDTYGDIASRSRSDTNILMAVDPVNKKILLVSTPRDTYTPLYNISGDVKDKLTHAGLYGPECSMGTLATLYNTQIEYYIRINFSSVVEIVNALDGIDVYSAYTFNSRNKAGYSYVEGMNHLDGDATLAFCRERYSFPDGDYQRGRNHIEVIKGVINRCTSPSILMNYSSLMSALNDSFQTNMAMDDITSLIKMQLDDGASWSFESMTLANTGSFSTTCYSLSGPSLYVGIINETSRQEIEDALAEFISAGK
ncbi:MAG: LCP family protein [Lachnospiraceae bacterium]